MNMYKISKTDLITHVNESRSEEYYKNNMYSLGYDRRY